MNMHPGPYRFAASTSHSRKRHEEVVDILLIHSFINLMLSVAAIENLVAVDMGVPEQGKQKIAILAALWRREPSTMIALTVKAAVNVRVRPAAAAPHSNPTSSGAFACLEQFMNKSGVA
jgi:hypothetical protein